MKNLNEILVENDHVDLGRRATIGTILTGVALAATGCTDALYTRVPVRTNGTPEQQSTVLKRSLMNSNQTTEKHISDSIANMSADPVSDLKHIPQDEREILKSDLVNSGNLNHKTVSTLKERYSDAVDLAGRVADVAKFLPIQHGMNLTHLGFDRSKSEEYSKATKSLGHAEIFGLERGLHSALDKLQSFSRTSALAAASESARGRSDKRISKDPVLKNYLSNLSNLSDDFIPRNLSAVLTALRLSAASNLAAGLSGPAYKTMCMADSIDAMMLNSRVLSDSEGRTVLHDVIGKEDYMKVLDRMHNATNSGRISVVANDMVFRRDRYNVLEKVADSTKPWASEKGYQSFNAANRAFMGDITEVTGRSSMGVLDVLSLVLPLRPARNVIEGISHLYAHGTVAESVNNDVVCASKRSMDFLCGNYNADFLIGSKDELRSGIFINGAILGVQAALLYLAFRGGSSSHHNSNGGGPGPGGNQGGGSGTYGGSLINGGLQGGYLR